MSRADPKPELKHTAVRVDDDTLARLDRLRRGLSTEWREATTSDILRATITVGLEIMEAAHARRRPRRAARRR